MSDRDGGRESPSDDRTGGSESDGARPDDGRPVDGERTDGERTTGDDRPDRESVDPATDGGATAGVEETLLSGTRIGQFVSVGAVGFAFDVTTSTALKEAGVFPEVAVFAGIEVAVVVMFLLNDRVTFAGEGAAGVRPTLRRLARSNVVRLGGIGVQLATFSAVFRLPAITWTVAGVDAWFVVAKATGIGAGLVVNYVAESLFTWRVTR